MTNLLANVFAIGRKAGDENQLTALLGALFRREPEALEKFLAKLNLAAGGDSSWNIDVELVHARGRFDLVLEKPGEAVVVIESKIHADLGEHQVRRYLTRLAKHTADLRSLVVLSRKEPLVDESDLCFAKESGIQVRCARWQDLAECLADPETNTLAGDFAELLVSENLASPAAIDADDWQALHGARRAFDRLERLLNTVAARLAEFEGMKQVARARATGERRVMTTLAKDSHLLRIGIAASDSSRRPDTPPIVWVGITDENVPKTERREWAESHAKLIDGGANQRWVNRSSAASSSSPQHSTPRSRLWSCSRASFGVTRPPS